MTALLDVRDLRVSFETEYGLARAVDGVSFALREDEVLGIVGESGSGKSVSMLSAMGLLPRGRTRLEGEVRYGGRDLLRCGERELRSVRGREISMIFQDPMSSLNPVLPVGWQIAEQVRAHEKVSKRAARARAIEQLAAVGIADAARRADDFPHEFSGGMRQRVMIAMALSCRPRVLIADEPTTALDVTIQAQILDLIRRLRTEFGTSVVLITHDMGVVAELADRVQVMYAGRIVEEGRTRDLFRDPQHPYTWSLLSAIPRLDRPRPRRLAAIPGAPPAISRPASGCSFADRCAYSEAGCAAAIPALAETGAAGRSAACHLPSERRAELRELALAGTRP